MASTTPRLNLHMPADDGSEPINVATDLNDNLERIDSVAGFIPSTAATPPSAIFDGMTTYETDTGRAKFRKGLAGAWNYLLAAGASFLSDIWMGMNNRLGMGTTTPSASVDIIVTTPTTAPVLKYKGNSEAFHRVELNYDGIRFGGGTVAPDVRIYRPTSNQISISGSVAMDGSLTVTGTTAVDNLNVSGDLNLGGVISTDVTVNGTVTVTDELTGDAIGVSQFRRRTSDLLRANSTTPAVDSVFDFPVLGNAIYLIEMLICYSGLNTSDFKCSWNVPANSSGPRYCLGMPTGSSDMLATTTMITAIQGFTTEVSYGTVTQTAFAGAQEKLVLATGADAGLVQFKWSQSTTSGTSSILRTGTTMKVTRIA